MFLYFTYTDKLQKQKKVDSKTETDKDKFLLIFFAIGTIILFFFIISYIVEKIFFPPSKVNKIENYYKVIEKVNEENNNNRKKLLRELDQNERQSAIKNYLYQKELNRCILEKFRICHQYLKNVGERLEKEKKNLENSLKCKELRKEYNYLAVFINSLGIDWNKKIDSIVGFIKKVVEFQKTYGDLDSFFSRYLKEPNEESNGSLLEEENNNNSRDNSYLNDDQKNILSNSIGLPISFPNVSNNIINADSERPIKRQKTIYFNNIKSKDALIKNNNNINPTEEISLNAEENNGYYVQEGNKKHINPNFLGDSQIQLEDIKKN